jgi:plastocyanin
MSRAPLAPAAVAAALSLFAADCGGDDEKSSGSVTVKSGQPVAVTADEYGFKPGTITVTGGGAKAPVRFNLRNDGSLPHDVHVRKGDDDLGGTDVVGGGKTAEGTVTLEPGDYEIFCSVGDHADLGMKGKLKIE